MASSKPKVVSTVKRGPASASVAVPAKVGRAVSVGFHATRNAAAKANAKAARAKAIAPLRKKKPGATAVVPKAVRETPVIYKKDDDKPLTERLNPKLLAQLRERKVTNAEAAAVLGVHETYLSRVLKDLGEEKVKGATMAHREARAELVATRNKHRAELAKRVNRQEVSIEKAAKDANCSVRTMFRWCAEYANVKKAA